MRRSDGLGHLVPPSSQLTAVQLDRLTWLMRSSGPSHFQRTSLRFVLRSTDLGWIAPYGLVAWTMYVRCKGPIEVGCGNVGEELRPVVALVDIIGMFPQIADRQRRLVGFHPGRGRVMCC